MKKMTFSEAADSLEAYPIHKQNFRGEAFKDLSQAYYMAIQVLRALGKMEEAKEIIEEIKND